MSKRAGPRRYTFLGEWEAAVVVEWLNNPIRSPNDLIERWVTLEREMPIGMMAGEETNRRVADLINDEVERLGLAWTWKATPTARSYELNFAPALDPEKTENWTESDKHMVPVFLQARVLASHALLDRIRKCQKQDCGLWFYAKVERQHFHSNDCRQSALAADPAWKEHRAKLMRENRRTKKLLAEGKKRGRKKS